MPVIHGKHDLRDPVTPVKDDMMGIVNRIKLFDPNLFVVLNHRTKCYEVHDLAAPGGRKHSMVLRVMEPDGTPRILDQRVLDTLMKNRPGRMDQIFKELDQMEEDREKMWEKKTDQMGDGMADDIKWMGRAVVTSVGWRDRTEKMSATREEIRNAGTTKPDIADSGSPS